MATATQEAPEGERLARIEASLEFLIREAGESREDMREMREDMREMRKDMRIYFLWILGALLGILTPILVGLLIAVIMTG